MPEVTSVCYPPGKEGGWAGAAGSQLFPIVDQIGAMLLQLLTAMAKITDLAGGPLARQQVKGASRAQALWSQSSVWHPGGQVSSLGSLGSSEPRERA